MNLSRLLVFLLVSIVLKTERVAARAADHVVVVVWDGLRPDFVNEKNTPVLFELSKRGVFFKNHHAAYPSSTEVNGVVLATGDHPSKTTIIGNREYRPKIDAIKEVKTEEVSAVARGDNISKGRYLGALTVAEILQNAGLRTAIAGTKPIAFLQDRYADIAKSDPVRAVNVFAGQVMCDGRPFSLGTRDGCPGEMAFADGYPSFPSIEFPNVMADSWTTGVFTDLICSKGLPKFSLVWLSEPDYSQHHSGLGTEMSLAALKSSDRCLQKILDAIDQKGLRDRTDIFVVSDHGFCTISRALDIVALLNRAGLRAVRSDPKPGDIMVVGNGGSALFYVSGHDSDVINRLVDFLQLSDFAGAIFCRSPHAGCFLMDEVRVDAPEAPDVIVSMRWSSDHNTAGVPGMIDSEDPNPGIDNALRLPGNGHHASLSTFDMHNTLIAAGPDFRPGLVSDVPSGNTDLVPTILHVLRAHSKGTLDGRILSEALIEGSSDLPGTRRRTSLATAIHGKQVWRQYLTTTNVGTATYFDAANGHATGKDQLWDPDSHVPFAIHGQFSPERELADTDFHVKSRAVAPDNTLWLAEDLGPFLLHVDDTGKLLEAPFEIPDPNKPEEHIRSITSPLVEQGAMERMLEVFRNHAELHGNRLRITLSPDNDLLADHDPATVVESRLRPPFGSGVGVADSEIVDVKRMQDHGFSLVPYTVNAKRRMLDLLELKVNGIISDQPDVLHEAISEFAAKYPEVHIFDMDGLIDITKFDAQGHRGGRNLRPENTLPAMEAGLDNLVTTLETDCGITKDGIPILNHDQFLAYKKMHRFSKDSYCEDDQVLIKDLSCADIQSDFRCDKLQPDRCTQKNDPKLSPVSVQFFGGDETKIYTPPTLQQLFDFVRAYVDYYKNGSGRDHPDASRRWKNASRVHFNIETKTNPRSDSDGMKFSGRDVPFRARTVPPGPFVRAIAEVIIRNGFASRSDIQSFDFRTLLIVQEEFPAIATVYLLGDFPRYDSPAISGSEDGGNLQDENKKPSPWLAGLAWPYRCTTVSSTRWEPADLKQDDDHKSLELTLTGVNGSERFERRIRFDPSTKQFQVMPVNK